MIPYISSTFLVSSLDDPQIEIWKNQFDLAQSRAMSLQSIIVRSMAKNTFENRVALDGKCSSTGIYVIAEDAEPYTPALERLIANPGLDPFEYLRAVPAKLSIGAPASMTASQLAIELGATGPIYSLLPGAKAFPFLCEQVELDQSEGKVDVCTFSVVTSFGKYFKSDAARHGAFVAAFSKEAPLAMEHLRRDLRRFSEQTGVRIG